MGYLNEAGNNVLNRYGIYNISDGIRNGNYTDSCSLFKIGDKNVKLYTHGDLDYISNNIG
jgi:hypothetical protein